MSMELILTVFAVIGFISSVITIYGWYYTHIKPWLKEKELLKHLAKSGKASREQVPRVSASTADRKTGFDPVHVRKKPSELPSKELEQKLFYYTYGNGRWDWRKSTREYKRRLREEIEKRKYFQRNTIGNKKKKGTMP